MQMAPDRDTFVCAALSYVDRIAQVTNMSKAVKIVSHSLTF